jgi:hypothetical protein
MAERGGEYRIARLLADVAGEAAGQVKAPGVDAALDTVRRRRRVRVAAAAVLALALLGGPAAWYAGQGSHDLPVTESPASRASDPAAVWTEPPASRASDPAAVWTEFVMCARANGHPDWPDPIVNEHGAATFAGEFDVKQALPTVSGPCGPILDRLPPRARPAGW